MFNYDEAKFVCDQIREFITHGVQLNTGYSYECKNVDSFDDAVAEKGGHLGFLESLLRNSLTLNLGFGYSDSDVFSEAGYPWNNGISKILNGYQRDDCEFSDVRRYFELLSQKLPRLDELIAAKNENVCGSEKFNLACKDFFDSVEKILTNILRNNPVKECNITPATYRNQRIDGTFVFTEKVTYAQKRKILSVLDFALQKRYRAIMPDLTSIYHISGLYIAFTDNGKKAAACDSIRIGIKPNSWASIGMDESAQFMPRIGMKRHQAI